MIIGHSRVLYKQQIQEVCQHGLLTERRSASDNKDKISFSVRSGVFEDI